jgi:hypothetical protein
MAAPAPEVNGARPSFIRLIWAVATKNDANTAGIVIFPYA